jgi:acetylornithine deacetylase/succinyl-diaminopimelate desuccinylase-like protein
MAEPFLPGAVDDVEVEHLRARTADVLPSVVADLAALVRIPSVSSPSSVPEILEDSAGAVADLLAGVGLTDVDVLRAEAEDGRPGAPAVVASSPGPAAPGAPRVLLYAHHDVQPPGDEGLWTDPPFRPTERDGRLYGRGAADDKAGIMAHVGALRVLGRDHGVAVTVFVEGEEEVGSPTFGSFLRAHGDRLAADVVVVADSANWRLGVPALTTSLRGLVDAVVEVSVLRHAVHSGLYGGPVLDAVTLLARLLATLHDDRGEVAVAGLVAGDVPAPEYDEVDFRADASVLPGVRLAGTGTIAGRLWARPAVSVVGLDATPVDRASNTLAPSARAKISLRLAPGQDPAEAERALHAHLLAHAPFGARVTVTPGERGRPFAAQTASPAMAAARWALEQAWGVPPVEVGIGGSIPFVADLVAAFPGAAVLVTGVEDPDSRAHAANESVHLRELERAVLAEALLIRRLGAAARPAG